MCKNICKIWPVKRNWCCDFGLPDGIPENDPHRKTIPILKSENDPHINFGQIQKRKMTPIYILGNNLKESDPQTGNGCHTKTQLYKNDLYNFYL